MTAPCSRDGERDRLGKARDVRLWLATGRRSLERGKRPHRNAELVLEVPLGAVGRCAAPQQEDGLEIVTLERVVRDERLANLRGERGGSLGQASDAPRQRAGEHGLPAGQHGHFGAPAAEVDQRERPGPAEIGRDDGQVRERERAVTDTVRFAAERRLDERDALADVLDARGAHEQR